MHKGTLSAERNHKGTLVLSITAQGGSPLPVPKLGRGADKLFLKHHHQQVSFERNESGAITHIQAGEDILFGSSANVNSPRVGGPSQKPTPVSQHISSGSVQTISQQRAKHALAAVKVWETKGKDDQKELKSYPSSFPAMILMSGFGQACAFYRSKGGNHMLMFEALAGWLNDQKVFSSKDLMKEIVNCDASKYQLAQVEALVYLDWLKKFAKAYLAEDKEGSNESASA